MFGFKKQEPAEPGIYGVINRLTDRFGSFTPQDRRDIMELVYQIAAHRNKPATVTVTATEPVTDAVAKRRAYYMKNRDRICAASRKYYNSARTPGFTPGLKNTNTLEEKRAYWRIKAHEKRILAQANPEDAAAQVKRLKQREYSRKAYRLKKAKLLGVDPSLVPVRHKKYGPWRKNRG